MKKTILILSLLFLISPCFAEEPKVYTDEDLGKYKQENYEKTYQYNQKVLEQNKIEYERQKEIEKTSFMVGNHKLTLGMTKDEVIRAIGQPYKINTSGGGYGVQEQWIYSNNVREYLGKGYKFYHTIENYLYLYFDNDILTSYQM